MPGCAVERCKTYNGKTKGTNIGYHYFPRDSKLREIWIAKCGREGGLNITNARVCSQHFAPDDYVRDLKGELLGISSKKRLKPNAVPTLYVHSESDNDPCTRKVVNTHGACMVSSVTTVRASANDPPKKGISIKQHRLNASKGCKIVRKRPRQSLAHIRPKPEDNNQSTSKILTKNSINSNCIENDAVSVLKVNTPSSANTVLVDSVLNNTSESTTSPNNTGMPHMLCIVVNELSDDVRQSVDKTVILDAKPDQSTTSGVSGCVASTSVTDNTALSNKNDKTVCFSTIRKVHFQIPRPLGTENRISGSDVRQRTRELLGHVKPKKNSIHNLAGKDASSERQNMLKSLKLLERMNNSLSKDYINLKVRNKLLNTQLVSARRNLRASVKKNKRQVEAEVNRVLEKVFTRNQIRCLLKDKMHVRWDENDMNKALALQKVSKIGYIYLRKNVGLPLPSLTTLKRWKSRLARGLEPRRATSHVHKQQDIIANCSAA